MTTYFNNTLPIDVLKNVFENFITDRRRRKDLITCSTVCHSWHAAAREVRGLSVKVVEDSLERLSRDVALFGQKVKTINIFQG